MWRYRSLAVVLLLGVAMLGCDGGGGGTPSQVEDPVFVPLPGTFSTPQTVTIGCATAGATIHYTTDGTDPTTASAVYAIPITVDTTTTVKAVAALAGWTDSNIVSGEFVIEIPNAADPVFAPPAGTYTVPQAVTITCATAGATIHYTTDGTDPTTASATYSGPLTVDASTTIKAMAVLAGWLDSGIASGAYVLQVADPELSPAPGTFTTPQMVTITCATAGAIIYYTTDGTDPTTTSDTYVVPITVDVTTTIKALAAQGVMDDSNVVTGEYVINRVADPAFDPAPGVYTMSQVVTITCATAGATIHYTTDGTDPTTASAVYSAPVAVDQTTTIKALAVKAGMGDSDVVTGDYVIQIVEDPIFAPPPGTYDTSATVTITCATAGATIYYTTDGTDPIVGSSDVYTAPLVLDVTTTLKVVAVKTGFADSGVVTGDYVIAVADPEFSPLAGTYTTSQTVTITCATPLATIHYTIDGIDPTTASNVYAVAIPVSVPTTLKALAVLAGLQDSNVVTADYVIQVATPTFAPTPGNYATTQSVVISCATAGATIHYTTDGSPPTIASPTYSTAISVSVNTVMKALAVKAGLVDSQIASASYVITTERVEAPVFSPAPGLYTTVQDVTITCATAGASIHYTTDGADPTTASTLYAGPIPGTMDVTRTIKAFAVEATMLDSNITQGVYDLPDVDGDGLSLPEEVYWSTSDIDTDSDDDGLPDDVEVRTWHTRPDLADTDGDGITDGDEIGKYQYSGNWTQKPYMFSPLVADIPQLNVSLEGPPEIEAIVTTSTVSSVSVAAERSGASATTVGHVDTTTHASSIERMETEQVETSLSVGMLGVSASTTASYGYAETTAREESVSYSQEQSVQNSAAWSKMNTYMQETGYTYEGGVVRATISVENCGDLTVVLESMALVACRRDPANGAVHYVGPAMTSTISAVSIPPHQFSAPISIPFETTVNQAPMEALLDHPESLIIKTATYTVNVDNGDGVERNFDHTLTTVGASCARIIIDYGPYDGTAAGAPYPPERHYVACNLRQLSTDGITLREAFEKHMHLNDPAMTLPDWEYTTGTYAGNNGLSSLRGIAASEADNALWLIVHRWMEGVDEKFAGYRQSEAAYSLDDIVIHTGDVVHLIYVKDADGDGLGFREEYTLGTSDESTDSDGDGISDPLEVDGYDVDVTADLTPPTFGVVLDSIHSGALTSNPALADTDGDGLDDLAEATGWVAKVGASTYIHVTSDPLDTDTDDDTLTDSEEAAYYAPASTGTDPRDPNSPPCEYDVELVQLFLVLPNGFVDMSCYSRWGYGGSTPNAHCHVSNVRYTTPGLNPVNDVHTVVFDRRRLGEARFVLDVFASGYQEWRAVALVSVGEMYEIDLYARCEGYPWAEVTARFRIYPSP